MKKRFGATRIAIVFLAAATCLSGGAAMSKEGIYRYWPKREPLLMTTEGTQDQHAPTRIELSLQSSFALTIGQLVSLGLTTEGASDGVTYRAAVSSVMSGLSVNPTSGLVSGVPNAPAGTVYSIAVEAVRDGSVIGTTDTVFRTLRAPLAIDKEPDGIELTAGESFPSFGVAVGAVGGDQNSITWSLLNAPDWLSIISSDPGIAVLRQTPDVEMTETPATIVTIVASDAEGRQDTKSFEVEVSATAVAPLEWQRISVGDRTSCGISTGGDAYCWGEGKYGRLGNGGADNTTVPAAVSGGRHFADITTGNVHSCGLTTTGDVYCWGTSNYGQLGDGGTYSSSLVPVAVSGGQSFAKISAGYYSACGITTEGEAYCWGHGDVGQIGNGAPTQVKNAIPVAVSGGHSFANISVGDTTSCGITTTGDAYCWGEGYDGQFGNGTSSSSPFPVLVSGEYKFAEISAGGTHVCGIATSGDAYCWGNGAYGQLGNGSTSDSLVPIAVAGGHLFAKISVDYYTSCGITTDGDAYCWGRGHVGQLGDGNAGGSGFGNIDNIHTSFVPVAVLGGHSFSQISIGGNTTVCGITTDKVAYCWGNGSYGQLGKGNTNNSFVPVPVAD
ncbi:MAG: hypothetical protein WBA15_03605 [Mesorhizobium sp.]